MGYSAIGGQHIFSPVFRIGYTARRVEARLLACETEIRTNEFNELLYPLNTLTSLPSPKIMDFSI